MHIQHIDLTKISATFYYYHLTKINRKVKRFLSASRNTLSVIYIDFGKSKSGAPQFFSGLHLILNLRDDATQCLVIE